MSRLSRLPHSLIALALIWLAAALPGHALADEAPRTGADAIPSFGPLLLQVSLSLLFVCLLAWLMIRFGLARLKPPASPEAHMELLDRLPLGARRSIVMLRAVDRVLVVGDTEAGLTLLSDLGPGSALTLTREDDGEAFAAAMDAAAEGELPQEPEAGPQPPDNMSV